MSDYDKLVEILRSYSTEVISYKIDGTFAYAVTAAADAIEKLVKDRNVLQLQNHLERCEHEHTRKERDAAVADFNQFAIYGASKESFACEWCKSQRSDGRCQWFIDHKDDKTCRGVHFEWRGVQEASK